MNYFFAFLLTNILVWANDLETNKIDLSNQKLTGKLAIQIALENNTNLKQFKEQINQVKAEKYSAYGITSPIISYMQEGMPNGDYSKFGEKRLALNQDLQFPYTSYLKLKSIDQKVTAMEAEYKWKQKELIAETKQSYVRIVYWKELIRLREEIKEISEKLYEIVNTKEELGQISSLDLLNAELSKLEAENDLNDAIRNLMLARYDLFYLIGLDTDKQKYSIAFQDSLTYFDFNISQNDILKRIEETYDYKSAIFYSNSASTAVTYSWSKLLPSINLSIYKQNYSDGFNFNGIELGLSIPLWLGIDKQTEIQQYEAQSRESQIRLHDTKLKIKKQIEHSWHSFDISRNIILNYKNNISEKSQKLLELTLESYQLGQTDLLNLLNVQKGYINSKIRYLDALMDYYKQIIDLEKYLENEVVLTN